MHKIIEDLNWRYACKRFNPNRNVSEQDFETIKEALRLTATSYGLQVMKFIIVEDREIREKLLAASYDQRQVVDASQLIVLCSRTDVDSKDVSSYMENIANTRDQKLEEVEGFGEFILQSVQNMDTTDILEWNRKQTYIALGHLLHTCASLRIDSTPMEGFQPDEYNRILGLTEDGYEATLVCPIGYRHAEDAAQYKKKVRRKNDELFSTK